MTHSATQGSSAGPLIRPAWTPATIGLMVLGFMVFWPLGLAMLAYIIWGDRLEGFKREMKWSGGNMRDNFKKNMNCNTSYTKASTGNVAFDEWRDSELDRLAEERRKLDAMRGEFDDHMRDLRRAKDQEEFDRFMNDRKKSSDKATKKSGSVPEIKEV